MIAKIRGSCWRNANEEGQGYDAPSFGNCRLEYLSGYRPADTSGGWFTDPGDPVDYPLVGLPIELSSRSLVASLAHRRWPGFVGDSVFA